MNQVLSGLAWVGKAFFVTGVALLVGAALTVVALIEGPNLEGKFFPVVIDMDFAQTDRREEVVEYVVSGRKVRVCDLIGYYSLSKREGTYVQSAIIHREPMATRPVGQQSFGRWLVRPDGVDILIEARHRCHPLWTTVTPLGTVTPF